MPDLTGANCQLHDQVPVHSPVLLCSTLRLGQPAIMGNANFITGSNLSHPDPFLPPPTAWSGLYEDRSIKPYCESISSLLPLLFFFDKMEALGPQPDPLEKLAFFICTSFLSAFFFF